MHFKNNFIRIFFLFAILINWNNLFSQSEEKNTELLIVGTIHKGNPNITGKTIYKVLSNYKPEIILMEWKTDFKPKWGLFRVDKNFKLQWNWLIGVLLRFKIIKAFADFSKMEEYTALKEFHRRNKMVPITGFDSLNESFTLKNYDKLIVQYIQILDNAHAQMGKKDSVQYANYRKLRNEYFGNYQIRTLENINEDIFYKKMDTLQCMEYQILEFAEKYIIDKKIVNDYKELLDFSSLRNNNMVHKIKEVIKKNKGKRIVVLTGLNHKYFVVDQLKKINYLGIHWNSLL